MKKTCLILILFLVSTPLFAGVVFEIETQETSSGKVEASEAVIEGKTLVMNVGDHSDRDMSVIFRGDHREMVIVDHDEKSYMVVDKEMVSGVASQLQGAMKQIESQLGNLDPEQAAKLKELMGGALPEAEEPAEGPKNELRKTSDEKDIEGYPCVRYDVFRDGEKLRELWVTPWNRVGGKDAFAVFGDLGDFVGELMGPFKNMASMSAGNTFFGNENPFEDWEDLAGFPVLIRMFENGKVTQEALVKSVTERKVDPSELAPDPSYSRRQMPTGR